MSRTVAPIPARPSVESPSVIVAFRFSRSRSRRPLAHCSFPELLLVVVVVVVRSYSVSLELAALQQEGRDRRDISADLSSSIPSVGSGSLNWSAVILASRGHIDEIIDVKWLLWHVSWVSVSLERLPEWLQDSTGCVSTVNTRRLRFRSATRCSWSRETDEVLLWLKNSSIIAWCNTL